MKRRCQWPLLAVVLLLGLTSAPLSAISPAAIMVYGGQARQPLVLRPSSPADYPTFGLLWWQAGAYNNPTPIDPQLWLGLKERPYVNLAIFWGRYDAGQLKPEGASQHGRFYPPTAAEPAVVVTTIPDMQKISNPIPTDLDRFAAAWSLSPEQLSTLKNFGFPVS